MKRKIKLRKPGNGAALLKKVVLYNSPASNENCQCCTVNMSKC